MTLWMAVIFGSVLVYSWKYLGFLIPERFVSSPRFRELAGYLTVALLAALVGIQSFAKGETIVVDERLPAVIVAGILFYLRVPFVVVIFLAALVAALLRAYL